VVAQVAPARSHAYFTGSAVVGTAAYRLYAGEVAVVETMMRVRADGGARVERLVCHPALPLVAGLDSERPAVHVWDFGTGEPHRLGTIGGDSAAYADTPAWGRGPTPGVAWHPRLPLLLVTGHGTVVRWAPDGTSEMDGLPPTADYHYLAFSPDGQTLWAWPSPGAEEDAWQPSSDAIHLPSGTVRACPPPVKEISRSSRWCPAPHRPVRQTPAHRRPS
jgi:hypothetical protein